MSSIDSSDVYAFDECSLQLVTTIKKVVTRRGTQPVMRVSYQFKGVQVLGAIRGTKEVVFRILDGKNSKFEVIDFLEYMRHFNAHRPLHVILDNYNMHRNKEVYEYVAQNYITLHFQPTHSPFLNGAEEIWRQLRQWLRNRLFTNVAKLKSAIYEFFVFNPTLNINIFRYIS